MPDSFRRRRYLKAAGLMSVVGTTGCLRLQSGSENGGTEQENLIELTPRWEKNVKGFLTADNDFFTGIRSVTRISSDGTTVFTTEEIASKYHFNLINGKQNALFADESGVYVGASTDSNQGGRVYAFEPTTGERRWMIQEPDDGLHDYIRSPTKYEDLILYNSYGTETNDSRKSTIKAVDIETGDHRWQMEFDNEIDTQALPIDDSLFVGLSDSGVREYEIDTREKLNEWDQHLGLRDVVAQDGVLYTSVGSLQALSIDTGEVLWSIEPDDRIATKPTVGSEAVFYGTESGYIQAYNKDTGDQIWETRIPGMITNPLRYTDGIIWAQTRRGDLVAVGEDEGLQYYADQFESDYSMAISDKILLESSTNTAYRITEN